MLYRYKSPVKIRDFCFLKYAKEVCCIGLLAAYKLQNFISLNTWILLYRFLLSKLNPVKPLLGANYRNNAVILYRCFLYTTGAYFVLYCYTYYGNNALAVLPVVFMPKRNVIDVIPYTGCSILAVVAPLFLYSTWMYFVLSLTTDAYFSCFTPCFLPPERILRYPFPLMRIFRCFTCCFYIQPERILCFPIL